MNDAQVEDWVDRYLRDELSDSEKNTLTDWLDADCENQDRFVASLEMNAALVETLCATQVPDREETATRKFWRRPVRAWSTAAAAAVIMGFIFIGGRPGSGPEPIAVLTRAINLEWQRPDRFGAELGQPIEPGWLRIKSGIAEITFGQGALVSVEGPAQIRIDDAMNCRSKFGKLSAVCPESAHGFTIHFRGGKVVDLGTQFALNSTAEGKTDVHVIDGEVIVALTDDEDHVLREEKLTTRLAVSLDPDAKKIETTVYNDELFSSLQAASMNRAQPIKLQLDFGHRAGLYTGINAPAHAAGDMVAHEGAWTQVVGDHSGSLLMADGNICPYPVQIDYGHGIDEIDWNAAPLDPTGSPYKKAGPIFDTALCQDHRPTKGNLGYRISGLPAGRYRIYALCRSVRRPLVAYDVSFGVNLDRQVQNPLLIPPMKTSSAENWVAGQTHAVSEIQISGPDDWATVITRYAPERSQEKNHLAGIRSVLLGLQVVMIK